MQYEADTVSTVWQMFTVMWMVIRQWSQLVGPNRQDSIQPVLHLHFHILRHHSLHILNFIPQLAASCPSLVYI